MSIIERVRDFLRPYDMNQKRTLTPAQVFNIGGSWEDYFATASGQSVTPETVMQAAQGACVRLLSDDIGSLPVDVYQRDGPITLPAPTPSWLTSPSGRRFDTTVTYLSDWVTSLGIDGNAFTLALPNVFDPQYLEVLDPATVGIELRDGEVHYLVSGAERRDYTDMNIIHVPWVRIPGQLRGVSPMTAGRESTGLELAATKWAAAFFREGGTLGGIVRVPGGPETVDADKLREQFQARHRGERNWWKPAVLTGGAEYDDIVLKPESAQLTVLWQHVMEQAAAVYHIPPHLLASQVAGGASYASIEERGIAYVRHAVRPIVTRFERSHSLLLPEGQFLKCNMNGLLRGDAKARAEFYRQMLDGKVMLREEARALEDLPWLGELGWLETPNNNGVSEPEPTEAPAEEEPRSITISDVFLRDEAAASLTERVADTAAAGAAVAAAEARKLAESVSAEVAELRQAIVTQADTIAALRDDRGRIEALLEERNRPPDITIDGDYVLYQRGSEVERKRVIRDSAGHVVGMVAA